MTPLMLTFPRDAHKGRHIAMGCASGSNLRYEVFQIGHSAWALEIEWNGRLSQKREFTSQRAAKSFARDHFRRRQIVKVAA